MNSEEKEKDKTMIDRIAPWPLEEKSNPKKKINQRMKRKNERHEIPHRRDVHHGI